MLGWSIGRRRRELRQITAAIDLNASGIKELSAADAWRDQSGSPPYRRGRYPDVTARAFESKVTAPFGVSPDKRRGDPATDYNASAQRLAHISRDAQSGLFLSIDAVADQGRRELAIGGGTEAESPQALMGHYPNIVGPKREHPT
jgi:hypothetical protein